MNREKTQEKCQAWLVTHANWFTEPGAAIASKWFETAVGPKVGHVYALPWRDYGLSLNASYWSEGRNALASASAWFGDGISDVEINAEMQRFSDAVEELVSQTYAVKLLPKDQEDGGLEDRQYNFAP